MSGITYRRLVRADLARIGEIDRTEANGRSQRSALFQAGTGFAGNLVPTGPDSCNPQICFPNRQRRSQGRREPKGDSAPPDPLPRETLKPWSAPAATTPRPDPSPRNLETLVRRSSCRVSAKTRQRRTSSASWRVRARPPLERSGDRSLERRVVELAPPRARNQCERRPVHALEPSVRAFATKNPLPTRMHRHDLVACPAVLLPKA
jgi:hypothetical protein